MSFYLATLSIIPLFLSRAFLPIFATAVFARFGRDWDVSWMGFFEDFTGIELLASIPAWAIEPQVMVVLGMLAGVELLLQHVPESRALLNGASDATIKAVGAGSVSYLLVGGDLDGILDIWASSGSLTDFQWGLGAQYTWSFALGGVVFFLASVRGLLYESLQEMDPEDNLGIQGFLAWAEDGVSFVGVFALILMPAVTAALALIAILLTLLLRSALLAMEKTKQTACGSCSELIPLCAPHCGRCGAVQPSPLKVGTLGWIRKEAVIDRSHHALQLQLTHRCSHCGVRMKGRSLSARCSVCDTPAFSSRAELDRYLETLRSRLPATLLISGAFSSVPLVGVVPGILYYKLNLISSLRAYVPRSSSMLVRVALRLIFLLLLFFQWVPFLGAISLPLMGLMDYSLSRRTLLRQQLPSSGSQPLLGGQPSPAR